MTRYDLINDETGRPITEGFSSLHEARRIARAIADERRICVQVCTRVLQCDDEWSRDHEEIVSPAPLKERK